MITKMRNILVYPAVICTRTSLSGCEFIVVFTIHILVFFLENILYIRVNSLLYVQLVLLFHMHCAPIS